MGRLSASDSESIGSHGSQYSVSSDRALLGYTASEDTPDISSGIGGRHQSYDVNLTRHQSYHNAMFEPGISLGDMEASYGPNDDDVDADYLVVQGDLMC